MIKHKAETEFPGILRSWVFQHVLACLGLLPEEFKENIYNEEWFI